MLHCIFKILTSIQWCLSQFSILSPLLVWSWLLEFLKLLDLKAIICKLGLFSLVFFSNVISWVCRYPFSLVKTMIFLLCSRIWSIILKKLLSCDSSCIFYSISTLCSNIISLTFNPYISSSLVAVSFFSLARASSTCYIIAFLKSRSNFAWLQNQNKVHMLFILFLHEY